VDGPSTTSFVRSFIAAESITVRESIGAWGVTIATESAFSSRSRWVTVFPARAPNDDPTCRSNRTSSVPPRVSATRVRSSASGAASVRYSAGRSSLTG